MRIRSATRYFTAWFTMLAILCALAAPSIARAVSAARGDIVLEMCGVSGTSLVSIPGDPAKPAKSSTPEHCKLCSMHGGAFAPPPGAQPSMFTIDAGERCPVLFFQSPSPLAVWSPVQSRAPPSRA